MSAPSTAGGRGRVGSGVAKPVSIGVGAACVVGVLFLALPVASLVGRALTSGSLSAALTDRAIADALVLSLGTTLASLLLVVAFGTPLAFVLARVAFPGRRLVEAVVDLPIVLPPSVAGLGLLLLLGRRGVLGGALEVLGVTIPFTTFAVVLAQTFVAAPLFIRSARAGFRLVEPEQEDAARVDGADEIAVFTRVTLPLSLPAMAAGAVLAWARAMGEFGATILFAGNIAGRTQTLPLFVYSEFQSSLDASIAAAAVLVLAALGVLLAVRLTDWRSVADGGMGRPTA